MEFKRLRVHALRLRVVAEREIHVAEEEVRPPARGAQRKGPMEPRQTLVGSTHEPAQPADLLMRIGIARVDLRPPPPELQLFTEPAINPIRAAEGDVGVAERRVEL